VGHAELLPASSSSSDLFGDGSTGSRLIITSAILKNYEGQESTVFGTEDLLTQVVIGDGSADSIHLPGSSTLLRGDTVEILSPLSADNLVIHGDGSTVKLNSTISSTTNIINDAVEVSGNFANPPARSITSTGGVLTINGTLNGDNHAGALAPVNQNNGPDDVILNATGSITITGAVGGISGNGLQHVSVNTNGGTVGDISFGSTVTLAGNLYIKKGLNVTFSGNVVIAGDLVIEDAADIRFEGTLTVGGSLRIMKAGNVTFTSNVAVSGSVAIGRPDDLSQVASVAFTSSARFDFGGHGGIYTSGAISFGNNIGQSGVLRPDSLTLAAGGTITFSSSAGLLLDSSVAFVVTSATNISFGSDVVSGNVTIGRTGGVTGNITFDGTSNSVESFDVTTSGANGTVTVKTLTVGAGNATITANNIDLINSITSTGTASTLTLKPYTASRAITIGTSPTGAPDAKLEFNSADLTAIKAGFASVIFGDLAAGTGDVFTGAIGSNHSFHQLVNRTVIVGGAITVTQNFDVSKQADYVRLIARTGAITVNGVINRGAINGDDLANEAFSERNDWIRLEAAGDIIVNRAIYAASRISLTAGTSGNGSVTVNSTGANSGLLRTITTTASSKRVELVAGETSGNITLVDDTGAETLRAVGASSSVVLRANGGTISQTGGLIVADTLAVWASGNVSLRTDVDTIGSLSLNGEVLPGGSGAAATANMIGSLSTIFVTGGGAGYTSAPTVTLTGGGGTGATATATVVGGFVTGITITNAGSGYTSAPTVSFSGGGATTAAAAIAQITPGAVASITVNSNGSGYTAAPIVTILGDGRTVATGTASIQGTVGGYLITSAGSGYTAIGLAAGSGTASATGSLTGGQLTTVNPGGAGAGYSSAPVFNVSGDGTGASVLATLAGSVSFIARTAGSGYTYAPTILITGGRATQAINGLQMVGTGSVSITNSGSITVANATTTPGANRGSFALTTTDGGNIALGYVNTSTAAITLVADGAITDADTGSDALPNLVTTGLVSLTANSGVGALGAADIDINAGSLQATNSVSGNIVVQHAGLTGLTIAGTGVRTLAGNGSVNIQSNALNSTTGTLTVNAPVTAHGSGTVRLQATGSASDVVVGNATVSSTSGAVSVLADRSVSFATGARVATAGADVFIEASTGSLTMASDSLVTATNANLRVRAQNSVALGGLNAGTGSVSVISVTSDITDAGDTFTNIVAGATRLTAATAIGTAAAALEIDSGTLSASSGAGGMTLVETNSVEIATVGVTTTRLNLDGTTTGVNDADQSDLATSANGNIVLTALAGSITLTDAVAANGTGRIYLSASSNIVANDDVTSGSGPITLVAGQSISFDADVVTNGDSVDLTATAGSISQTDGSKVQTSGGSIRAFAGGNVTVASFNAAAGNISVIAQAGSILDAGDTAIDFIAAGLRLNAGVGIGPIETTVATLAAAAGAGGIQISETNDLVIDAVSVSVNRVAVNHTTSVVTDDPQSDLVATSGGSISLTTGGTLTLNKGDTDDDVVTVDGAGAITLDVTGDIVMADGTIARAASGSVSFEATGAIQLSIITATSGDITLASGAAITDVLTGEAANLTTTGLTTLSAVNGIGAPGAADIDTAVGSLNATNTTSGHIVLHEADNVTITGLSNTAVGGHVVLSSDAGAITATGPITAAANLRLDADTDIVASAAISATSITLLAGDSIDLQTGASLAASGAGTLDVEATTGSITFANAVAATTAGGHIRLLAATDVTVTGLNAATGSVTVTATAGSILNAGDTLRDLVAATARLTAAIGIGPLETTVATVAASATTGGIALSELNDLTVGTIAALSVNRVALDGTTPSTVGDAAATSDLTATTGVITLTSGGIVTLTDGTVANGQAISTTTGAISITAAQSVIFQASVVSTSGNLTIEGTAGALVDDTAGEAALLVTTGLASLTAATGIGTSGAGDIDTTVGSLQALLTTSGGIYIHETDTLVVASGGIVTQAANSPVSVVVTTGPLTVNGGITAHGSGNIHINAAAGAATFNAAVASTSGHVTVLASGNLTFNDDVSTTGTLNLVSDATITQADGSLISAGAADIRLHAATHIAVAGILTTGNVALTAVSGSITDNGDTHVDVRASGLRLEAGTFLGTAANHLETTVTTLSAWAKNGGIFILESDGLTIADVTATVNVVLADATAAGTFNVAARSDLTATGDIVLRSTTGDIVLNDGATAVGTAVTGDDILIDALAGNLTANADVLSGTGHITLKADDNIALTANVDVTTVGPGSVSINAGTGALTMHGTANVTSTGNTVHLRAEGDITVGNVYSQNVSIDSDAGSIINAALSSKNVTAYQLRLQAQNSIGVAGRHLTTNIDNISALATTGSIFITEDNGATVQDVATAVTEFNFDATSTIVPTALQSDLTAAGDIVLVATLGNITLNDGTANNAGTVVTGDNILIDALAGNVTANADIKSTTGHITLKADDNIALTAGVDVVTATPGTVSLDAETGTLTMHGTATIVASNSSARLRALGDITVGNVTATDVSIDTDAGSIINAELSTKNVTADNLRLQANGSIGTSARHLTTNIDIVTALAATGSIYVTEDNGAIVQNVTVSVTDFNSDATSDVVTDNAQSDFTTGLNGNIVLVATLGDITLNDGGATNANSAVTAHGTGNILIDALAGNVTANADIKSTTGHITVKADDNIALTANVDVVTATPGTVSLDAETGTLTMHGTATIVASNSSARLRALGDITVGNVTATDVSIDTDAGSIINAALSTKNVTADNLRLQAQNSIGTSARHLTTNIDIVSALATTGSIYVTEDNGAIVQNVTVSVTDFHSDATSDVVTDNAQSDFTTGLNGNIVLVATLGDITLNDGGATNANSAVTAHGTGNILIDALAGNVTANADIKSTTGHITLKADDNIALTAGVDVVTATPGTVSLDAETGTLTMHGTATIVASNSSARLRALGDITVGNVTATDVSIDTDAGSIINAELSTKNVTADNLRLQANGSIGTSARHLTTNIDIVTALAATGSIYVTEDNGAIVQNVTVSVTDFNSDATSDVVTDNAQSDFTTGLNGNIVLVATLGDITLNDGGATNANSAVTAHGTGNILIDALAGNVTANADIKSTTGHITVKADDNIALTANVDVTTATPGTVSLDAETGTLTIHGTATIVATNSSARLRAQGDITVGNVTATNVSIDTDAGSIINAALSTKNVTATNLRLQSQVAIGTSARHLTTNIDVITALASTGSIYVTEDNTATVQNVTVSVTDFNANATTSLVSDAAQSDFTTGLNGNIVLVATLGDIILNDGGATNANSAVTAHGTGNILIDAVAGNVTANADIKSTTGHITVKADDNIGLTANVDVVTATPGTVSLDAETGTLTMHGTATVVAANSSARLRAQGDITVGNVTATNVSIDTDAGSIINAAGSSKNVTAENLRLQAQASIGTASRHLTTNIDIVSALATTGSIYVTEDNDAIVQNVTVSVTDFHSDATSDVVTDIAQSDLTAAGNIVLVATLGNITLNDGTANNTGTVVTGDNILLDALAGNVTANADILSGSGHITVKADDNIALTANVDVTTTGTASLDAETGTLTMHGTANVNATSARLRALGDITVGNVTATDVSIDTDAGSIINAALSTKNVTADNLRLQAQNSIGTASRHLTTNIDIVSALATTGAIYVTEDNTATVQNVTVSVTDFHSDATSDVVTDIAQSDLTAAGNIVLVATLGNITLNDGTANNTGTAVTGDNILIDALAGDVTANADILSDTGHVTLKADDNIDLTANVDVTTTGTASLDAETGTLTMHGTANVNATSARLRAEGNITVGNVTATNVSIDTDAGSIINAALSTKNVTAENLRLQAQNSIGTSARHLTTNIDIVSALATTGAIYVTEDNTAIVQDVSVSVTDFNSDATTSVVTDVAQSDFTAAGNIVLVATLGSITLNDGTANNTGTVVTGDNILIDAIAGNVTANADILSGSGHITLKADDNIALTANVDVVTAGTGTVSLDAETGTLTMHGTATIVASNSSARLRAQGDITVGNLTATNVSIDTDAGSIINAALSTKNVTAENLRLQANGSIGTSARHLTTNINVVTALATTGSIYVTEDNAATVQNVTVSVTDFNANATTSLVSDAAQSDFTTGLNGNIALVATLGDITLNDGGATNANSAVTAHGTGNILIDAVAGNVTANADIKSTTGHITLKADDNVALTANVDITTAAPGTVSLDAETGTLTMHGTATIVASNSSARLRAQGDITIGNVTATNVSIDTDAGSIVNAALSTKNVTAENLRLQANGSIGTSARHLTTNINVVTALASTGSIYVTEDNAATVQNVTVSVTDFNANATTSLVSDAAQSDFTTSLNGNIVLVATLGDITLNDGGATNANSAVTAHGSGNILIDALAGNVTANADIKSTAGHITVKADDNIALTADVDVVTATPGTVSLDAETGTLTMAGTASVVAASSSVRLRAQGDITVGNVSAMNVSIDTDAGSIINAAGSFNNVAAINLRLQAQAGIGTSARHLTTRINNITALASTGSIYVTEESGATVQNVTVSVTDFNGDTSTSLVTDAAQSDLTTGQNGNIVLIATLGDIILNDGGATNANTTVTAHGTGSILIDALAGNVTANADIKSTTGHITLKADDNVALTANVDITTAAPGTVSLDAETGTLTMAGTATVVATNSSARLRAQGDITIGNVTATNVSIDTDAGSIINAEGSSKNVTAENLRLQANGSIGTSARHLTTNINAITALASTGSIYVTEDNAATVQNVTVSVTHFNGNATMSVVTDVAQSDLTTGLNGNIVLVATLGDLTFNDGSATNAGTAVSANGSGHVLLAASAGSVTANADILGGTGHITVSAASSLTLNATADITTGGAGTLNLAAGAGSVTQADNSRLTSANGDIRVSAATDITVGGITTNANVSLVAGSGSIFDAGDVSGGADIVAAGLRATAAIGIGTSAAPLETTVAMLAARATSGGIHLRESDAVTVGTVATTVQSVGAGATLTPVADVSLAGLLTTAGNGPIDLRTADGALTIAADSATHGSGAFNLQAGGGSGNLILGAVVSSTTGALTLTAGARIRETTTTETPVIVTGGVLTLGAVTGIGETGKADLDVSAPSLSFTNSGAGLAYLKSHRADATLTGASLADSGSLIFTQVTGGLAITGPVIIANGAATFRVPGALTLTNAPITTGAGLTLTSATLNATGSNLTAGDLLRIGASGNIVVDAATTLAGGSVTLGAGGSLAVGQVNATGLLDIRAAVDVSTVSNTTSLVAGQFRIAAKGNAGSDASPLRVDAGSTDVTVDGVTRIVYLNGLTVGRGGLTFDTDPDAEQVITVEGGVIDSIGGSIVDNGTGTLQVESEDPLTLGTGIVSVGGDITVTAPSISDGTVDENALLSALNGRVTLVTETGVGSTGAGDIDIVASEVAATTQTGSLHLESLGSISIAGAGLVISNPVAAGLISMLTSSGNLTLTAPVTNSGSGGISLLVPQGSFTMNALPTISSSTGAITIESLGLMTLGRIISTTGIVSLTTQDSISTVNLLNFPNITSYARPVLSMQQSINILVDADTVFAIGPNYPDGVEIARGGSDDIDMSIYSSILTGND
jgi:hypothetical protein